MTRLRSALAIALAAAVACNSIESPPSPPVNSCPANPCIAYNQPGPSPTCTEGVCLVGAPATDLVLVVQLPVASAFAPGSTFALPFDQMFDELTLHPIVGCERPTCASLPPFVPIQGAYLIAPKAASTDVDFPLGNPSYTALPVDATYQLLWPPTGGPGGTLASSLGLPIEPVQGVPIELPPGGAPGPGAGPSMAFRAYMQPGSYQVVLRPSPPFSRVFGPEVRDFAVASNGAPSIPPVTDFDVTRETGSGPTIPTFDIARAGGLDGWVAYLRDASRLIVSNVVPLAGTSTRAVFATNHTAPSVDALAGAELVIAPPLGTPYPTAVFAPIGNVLPASEKYPLLPAPAMLSGSIFADDPDNPAPVPADVVFEALSIMDANGISNSSNFEFVTQARARPGPPLGLSTYSIALPQGSYRVSVRPLDTSFQATTVALTIGAQNDLSAGNVAVAPPRLVSGTAAIADGRPLSGAVVEAVPVGCVGVTSPWCLPREASTTSAVDGSYLLALDPGQYLLRVRPADGTRFPWMVGSSSVGPGDKPATLAAIAVPAPLAAGLTLVDPTGTPLARAQVRVFSLAPSAGAVELGRARTDAAGRFEMYVPAPAQ